MARVQADPGLEKALKGIMLQIYTIGAHNGLRISDVLRLQVQHVRAYRPTIREQKTGKAKRLYIPSKLRQQLIATTEDKQPSDWLFPSPNDPTKPISRQAVYKAFRRAERKRGGTKHIGTHTMRKNYAQKLLRKGASLKRIQAKLNHRYLSDTLRYVTDKSLEELIEGGTANE